MIQHHSDHGTSKDTVNPRVDSSPLGLGSGVGLDTNISKNVLNFFLEILIKFLNFF